MIVRVPADVPIHRASVGADPTNMGNRQPDNFHDNFKPYVYRGLGFDLLTPELGEDWERGTGAPPPSRPKPKPKPKPRKRKKRMTHAQVRERIHGPSFLPPPTPEMVAEQDRQLLAQAPPGNSHYYKRKRRPTPSPEWQPMKGDDIDALLNDLA